MEVNEAQEKVDITIKEYGGYWEPLSMLARLSEEVGELARAINIKYGGKKGKSKDEERDIKDELADVFYTVLALSNKFEIDLDEALNKKIEKSHEKLKEVYKE